ncbi:hypothetical protein ADEAN_000283800 [Angomonas deanei]|uniref:Uncharacterized protein n=1 Tax=Angomonas deanei TaxID=59799 RepID=A0A7G2C9E3_9TRYP|nr:hypothetical protein ADEAN_000283800 [Angomonas deanei]
MDGSLDRLFTAMVENSVYLQGVGTVCRQSAFDETVTDLGQSCRMKEGLSKAVFKDLYSYSPREPEDSFTRGSEVASEVASSSAGWSPPFTGANSQDSFEDVTYASLHDRQNTRAREYLLSHRRNRVGSTQGYSLL